MGSNLACRSFCAGITLICSCALPAADTVYSDHGVNGTGVFPAKDLVTEFWDMPEGVTVDSLAPKSERSAAKWARTKPKTDYPAGSQKNIVWRATIPHWGNNAPIVIQNKVFLLYEDGWKAEAPMLLCLDVNTGKTLWDKPVDHLDALPASEQSTAKEARAKEHQRFREYMTWSNKIYYNNKEHRWMTDAEKDAVFPQLQKEAKAAGWLFNNHWIASGYSRTRDRYGIKFGGKNKDGGIPADKSLIDNYSTVMKNGWLMRQHWTTEQPWYGVTHGSAISDGTTIFAVTAIGGAAAYAPDGTLLWVNWLQPEKRYYRSGKVGNVASPTLSGDTLLYYHRDGGTLFGVDKASGKVRYASKIPLGESKKTGNKAPIRGHGHIGPGSTPVVLDLSGTKVVIPGNGIVFRVSDGKILGMIDGPQHSYFDMTGTGNIFFTTFQPTQKKEPRRIGAVQLGLDGDKLTQTVLWRSEDPVGNWEAGSSLAVDQGLLYLKLRGAKGKGATGLCTIDIKTGKVVKKGAPQSEYFAIADTQFVVKGSGRSQTRFRKIIVGDKASMKASGEGFLVEPPASGEIADRHIAFLGWPEIWTGYQKLSVWGNRIFVRTNDYLWCVGDPSKPFTAPSPISK